MTRRVGIGLTAGPSLATIDAALVEIDPNPIRLKPVELIEFLPVPVPPDLRARLDAHLDGLDAALAEAVRQPMAAQAGARRLVLTHFSARYPNNQVFADEASAIHDDVVAADELATIPVPPR